MSLTVENSPTVADKRSRGKAYPVTPDGRYFVVKDRLWRCTNPQLAEDVRAGAVQDLMNARRAIQNAADAAELKSARAQVHAAKVTLGERGPAWWTDGAVDVNRHHPKNTRYADWWAALCRPNNSQPIT